MVEAIFLRRVQRVWQAGPPIGCVGPQENVYSGAFVYINNLLKNIL